MGELGRDWIVNWIAQIEAPEKKGIVSNPWNKSLNGLSDINSSQANWCLKQL